MAVNTVIGAVIAMLINLITAFVALFTNDATLTVGMILQSTWIVMLGGAIVSFLKDYQAISTRRVVNKVTGTGDGGGTVE